MLSFLEEKIQKREKISISARHCFEKLKQYLGGLAIFLKPLVCEGLWKIAKSHKFGFSFSKQHRAEVFKMQQFNTGPVMHLRVVQLSRNFGYKPKNWNLWAPFFLPLIILTNRYRVGDPPVVSSALCKKRAFYRR